MRRREHRTFPIHPLECSDTIAASWLTGAPGHGSGGPVRLGTPVVSGLLCPFRSRGTPSASFLVHLGCGTFLLADCRLIFLLQGTQWCCALLQFFFCGLGSAPVPRPVSSTVGMFRVCLIRGSSSAPEPYIRRRPYASTTLRSARLVLILRWRTIEFATRRRRPKSLAPAITDSEWSLSA